MAEGGSTLKFILDIDDDDVTRAQQLLGTSENLEKRAKKEKDIHSTGDIVIEKMMKKISLEENKSLHSLDNIKKELDALSDKIERTENYIKFLNKLVEFLNKFPQDEIIKENEKLSTHFSMGQKDYILFFWKDNTVQELRSILKQRLKEQKKYLDYLEPQYELYNNMKEKQMKYKTLLPEIEKSLCYSDALMNIQGYFSKNQDTLMKKNNKSLFDIMSQLTKEYGKLLYLIPYKCENKSVSEIQEILSEEYCDQLVRCEDLQNKSQKCLRQIKELEKEDLEMDIFDYASEIEQSSYNLYLNVLNFKESLDCNANAATMVNNPSCNNLEFGTVKNMNGKAHYKVNCNDEIKWIIPSVETLSIEEMPANSSFFSESYSSSLDEEEIDMNNLGDELVVSSIAYENIDIKEDECVIM